MNQEQDRRRAAANQNKQAGIDPDVGAFQIDLNQPDSFNLDMQEMNMNEEEIAYAEKFKEYGIMGGGGTQEPEPAQNYSKYTNNGKKTIEQEMNEMYEKMYGIPMDDDDMDMDMQPMDEEEFRATLNGANQSNLDIIHENADGEIDVSGSKGTTTQSISNSGKQDSPPIDNTKGKAKK